MGQICITYVTNHFTLFGTVNLAIQSDTFSNHDSTFRASGNGKNKRLKRLFSNIELFKPRDKIKILLNSFSRSRLFFRSDLWPARLGHISERKKLGL